MCNSVWSRHCPCIPELTTAVVTCTGLRWSPATAHGGGADEAHPSQTVGLWAANGCWGERVASTEMGLPMIHD